jgi:hypothetical protein
MPKSLLSSYFEFMLKSTNLRDYKAIIRHVDSELEYWTVIRERRAEIASIKFTFIPPNALDADDEIYDLIKVIQSEASPGIQQHSYKTPAGQMNLETPHLEASARIALKGGGDAELRGDRGELIYSSYTNPTNF